MFKITLETFNYENTANNEVFLVILVHMKRHGLPQKIFFALRASVWSKNKGGGGRAHPMDPSLGSLVTADEKARTV